MKDQGYSVGADEKFLYADKTMVITSTEKRRRARMTDCTKDGDQQANQHHVSLSAQMLTSQKSSADEEGARNRWEHVKMKVQG